jgi:polysaccharide export outer membrane protein
MKKLATYIFAFVSMLSPAMAQIQVGQSVIIKIMGVPADQKELINETYPVAKTGMVNVPMLGDIKAAGLEAHELAKSIEKAYREGGIYSNPAIQVIANNNQGGIVEQRVHLAGDVRAPGQRPFIDGLTAFQAIQAAGGANEFGAMNRVILWRAGKQQVIDMKSAEGKAVVTQPNDMIEVPRKNIIGQ